MNESQTFSHHRPDLGRPNARRALVAFLALLLTGAACASAPGAGGGLKVTRLATVAEPPANVAAYFSVASKEGEPLGDLDLPNFKVFENGKLVSEKKAKRALLDTTPIEAVLVHVLLDVSGPVIDGEDYPDLVSSVGKLVETVAKSGQAAVSLFDGEDEIVPMLGFGASGEKAAFDSIRHFRPRDRNGNLNGAIVQGLDVLDKQLASATAPFQYGMLVVVTDRGDLAHKVTADAVKKRIAASPASVKIVAFGPKADKAGLEPLATGGLLISDEPKDFAKQLTSVAKGIDDAANARYLFSYCSNKREGNPTLTLVIETADDHGRLMYKFSADGFRGGCSAKHRPLFDKPAKDAKSDE